MEELDVDKALIYYTDNRLDDPLVKIVQDTILASNLPIVTVSLRTENTPVIFGCSYLMEGKRCYYTMVKQIILALSKAEAKHVFFTEADVLYPKSHFDFTPERNDIFYYNDNVCRWDYYSDLVISYDRLISLSGLCVNREFALSHFQARIDKMDCYLDKFDREPLFVRRWGFEPGTKKTKRGGFSNDDYETWSSEYPMVDIRHDKTFSPSKMTIESFKHPPTGWSESTIDRIPGWNIRKLFNLCYQSA